ncbi:MAG: DUF488 domain-containing protein [Pseudomonadota bacterium]
MAIRTKRIYEPATDDDGLRVLIDRLWPRGLSKANAKVDLWLKELAPSHELRKWFDHRADRWPEFQKRYAVELKDQTEAMAMLRREAKKRTVTLLFASRETKLNNASALKRMLDR